MTVRVEHARSAVAPRRRTGWLLAAVLVAAAAIPAAAEPPGESAPGAPAAGATPEGARYALLVGVTEYPGIRAHLEAQGRAEQYESQVVLRGPARDVALVRKVLVRSLGFVDDPAHLRVLTGWPDDPVARPTRENILGALGDLARRAAKGDFVFVLLAGHGTQVPDDGTDEADGYDEAFLPADAGPWSHRDQEVEGAIRDETLGAALRAVSARGAHVWLVVDACHSGTMTRSGPEDEVRYRHLSPATLGVPEVAPRGEASAADGGSAEGPSDGRGLVAFYAAQSNRRAPEMRLPKGGEGEPHGLLSFTLAGILDRFGASVSYQEVLQRLFSEYQALRWDGCSPRADGDLAAFVGGGARASAPPLLLRQEDGRLVLSAGRLAGIEAGSILEVRDPPGAERPGAVIGHVRVTTATLVGATCVKASRPGPDLPAIEGVRAACPARVVEASLGDRRVRVLVARPDGAPVPEADLPPAVREAFTADAPFARVDDPRRAEWTILLAPRGWTLRPVDRGEGAPSFAVDADTLRGALIRVARAENLKRLVLSGAAEALEEGVSVNLERAVPGGGYETLAAGAPLRPGDRIRVRVQNESRDVADVHAFLLDGGYGITQLFPTGGASSRLEADERDPVHGRRFVVTDDTQGVEHFVALVVPQPDPNAASALDLSWLAQDRLPERTRGAGAGAAEGLLKDLAFGGPRVRGASSEVAALMGRIVPLVTGYARRSPRVPEGGAGAILVGEDAFGALIAGASAGVFGDLGSAKPPPPDAAPDAARAAARAVVLVETVAGHGTGVRLAGEEALVLTSLAVARGARRDAADGLPRLRVRVRVEDPKSGRIEASPRAAEAVVAAADPRTGLALLRVEDLGALAWVPGAAPAAAGAPGVLRVGHAGPGALWAARKAAARAAGAEDFAATLRARAQAPAAAAEAFGEARAKAGPVLLVEDAPAAPGELGAALFAADGTLAGVLVGAGPGGEGQGSWYAGAEAVRAFLATPPPMGAPDAWALSPAVRLLPPTDAFPATVLVAEGGGRRQVLVDLHGPERAPAAGAAEAERLVRERALRPQFALHEEPGRRTAFYDRDDDGAFDLVLVDEDADEAADARFVLGPDGWSAQGAVSVPLLRSLAFDWGKSASGADPGEMETRAGAVFRALFGE